MAVAPSSPTFDLSSLCLCWGKLFYTEDGQTVNSKQRLLNNQDIDTSYSVLRSEDEDSLAGFQLTTTNAYVKVMQDGISDYVILKDDNGLTKFSLTNTHGFVNIEWLPEPIVNTWSPGKIENLIIPEENIDNKMKHEKPSGVNDSVVTEWSPSKGKGSTLQPANKDNKVTKAKSPRRDNKQTVQKPIQAKQAAVNKSSPPKAPNSNVETKNVKNKPHPAKKENEKSNKHRNDKSVLSSGGHQQADKTDGTKEQPNQIQNALRLNSFISQAQVHNDQHSMAGTKENLEKQPVDQNHSKKQTLNNESPDSKDSNDSMPSSLEDNHIGAVSKGHYGMLEASFNYNEKTKKKKVPTATLR